MEQFAQSEFFFYHIAPHLTLVKTVFFLGIFGLVGVVAQSVRIAIEEDEAEEDSDNG